MHQGCRQSASVVPACRGLLADVGAAPIYAKAFDVAQCTIRHITPAADQNRRPRGRNENDDPGSSADLVSRPGHYASRSRAYSKTRHMR